MKNVRFLFGLMLFTHYATKMCAQNEWGGVKRSELLQMLSLKQPDSSRAAMLLQISRTYLKTQNPDSALIYARRAVEFCNAARLSKLNDEAYFLTVRILATKEDIPGANRLISQARGYLKVRMLLELGEHFTFKPGAFTKDLNKAYPYIQHAHKLSDSLHSVEGTQNSLCLQGKYYYASGMLETGEECFLKNIRECQRMGDKNLEAHWWSEMARYMPSNPIFFQHALQAELKAFALYGEAGNVKEQTYTLRDVAAYYREQGNFDLAAATMDTVLSRLKMLKVKKLYTTYMEYANIEIARGNSNRAYDFLIRATKNMDSLHEDYLSGHLAKLSGEVFMIMNENRKALKSFKNALDVFQGRRDFQVFYLCRKIVQCHILLNETDPALSFLKNFEKNNIPVWIGDLETLKASEGDCYAAAKKYTEAERSYLEMIRLDKEAIEEKNRQIRYSSSVAGTEANFIIGKFYADRGEYVKSGGYLNIALTPFISPIRLEMQRDIQGMLFRVDTAAGHLQFAIAHQILFKQLSDSILNEVKNREIAELQVKYETEAKDQNIINLTQEAKNERDNTAKMRTFTIIGISMMLIISGLIYSQYRSKQKKNREINEKNRALENLVKEKEWLVKEIHHRVKNNLQTIVSLLESQSVNLKSDALSALQDSRNRIYAMSLVHQKLYKEDFVSSINLAIYLPELVEYLRESFNIRQRIRFSLDIIPLELDVSQAIPLGLILNEAIINSIKYAFVGRETNNEITIQMKRKQNHLVELRVTDNGTGLTDDYEKKAKSALGLKLMRGLTRELQGTFNLESYNGTTISVTFISKTALSESLMLEVS